VGLGISGVHHGFGNDVLMTEGLRIVAAVENSRASWKQNSVALSAKSPFGLDSSDADRLRSICF
jgi:hypothetical protein